MIKSEQAKKMGKVIARAWTDEKFHAALRKDPAATLHGAGIAVPKGVNVKLLEDTADTVHVVLPSRPAHLKDEQLKSDDVHPDICKPFC